MGRLGEWLDEPDQFDVMTAVLHHRGLIRPTRMLMALVAASAALVPISLLMPTFGDVTVGVVLVSLLGGGLACVMTWFWLTRWPTQRVSLISVLIGTVCVAAFSICQPTSALAVLTCTAAAVTGGYIGFFHNTRALLFNIAVGLSATAFAACRLATETDVATATAAFWIMWLINTTVPLAIRGTSRAMSHYATRSDEDPLTGLLNRRAFLEIVERRLIADMVSDHLVVIMVDLDDFKRVNDTHGHAEGDRVLLRVADILREHAPTDSAICRSGGEEFLIAVAIHHEEAAAIATPLCEAIAARLGDVSASVGVAAVPRNGVQAAPRPVEVLDELIGAADSAMYEAKRSGGNRVVVGAR